MTEGGRADADARVSALCEALDRQSALIGYCPWCPASFMTGAETSHAPAQRSSLAANWSAARVASAMIVTCGLTDGDEGTTLPSAT